MKITYDAQKNANNIEARHLSFDQAADFDFETAFIVIDDRRDYQETRYRALGLLNDRVHCLVFTETVDGIRVISFRKANQREVKLYVYNSINRG